jgi:hypothetical protein
MLELGGEPKPAPEPELLDAPAMAKRLNVSENWIRTKQRARKLPFKQFGRYVRFDPIEVAAALARSDGR